MPWARRWAVAGLLIAAAGCASERDGAALIEPTYSHQAEPTQAVAQVEERNRP